LLQYTECYHQSHLARAVK